MRDAVVLPLRLLLIRWPLTVRVALDLRGRSGVCGLLSVAVDVLVTVSALGGVEMDIDGACAAGGWQPWGFFYLHDCWHWRVPSRLSLVCEGCRVEDSWARWAVGRR